MTTFFQYQLLYIGKVSQKRIEASIATAKIPGRWWCLKLYTDLFLDNELQHKCIWNFIGENKSICNIREIVKMGRSNWLKRDKHKEIPLLSKRACTLRYKVLKRTGLYSHLENPHPAPFLWSYRTESQGTSLLILKGDFIEIPPSAVYLTLT